MFFQPNTIISYLGHSLAIMMSLCIGLNASSCRCNNIKQPGRSRSSGNESSGSGYGSLNMQVSPTSLIDQKKDIVATFNLNDKNKIADLTQFKLKLSWVETGGKGSKISYVDATSSSKVIAHELKETMAHFVNKKELKSEEPALKITFNLDPGPTVHGLDVNFELLDPTGKVQGAYTVTWKKIDSLVHLKVSYDPFSESITYSIQNTSQEAIKKLQLRYVNTSKDVVAQNILLNQKKENTLLCGDLAGGKSTGDRRLNLDSSPGVNTTFTFEVLYEGTPIATQQVEVTAMPVNLSLIAQGPSFLVGSKKQVVYTIQKAPGSGPVTANQLNLSMQTTGGATLLYNKLPITELSGDQLEKLGSEYRLILEINPGIDTIVTSTVQLNYIGNPIDKAQTFTWQTELSQANKELFEAVSDNDPEKVKQALQKNGIQINSTDENGKTLLHVAAEKCKPEIIKLLLDAGADIHAKQNGYSRQSPFYSAVDHKNEEAIKVFLASGIDINGVDEGDYWNPLTDYTIGGDIEAMKLLLAHGADPNARNSWGATALQEAVLRSNHREEVIKLLLAKGADINTKNNRGNTPLHDVYAAQEGIAAIELLLDQGADINAIDNEGNTLLHYTATMWMPESFAKILLDRGAQKDIKNNQGKTALDLAKLSNRPEIKKLFGIPTV